MSSSISNRLQGASAVPSAAAPSDELIEQLRALPAQSRDNILDSLAEKRPGFVNRIRQLLAQAPTAGETADEPTETAQEKAKAMAKAAQMAQFDPLQWMQGAQGLSLLDFLNPIQGAAAPAEEPPQAPEDFQSQTALSAYTSNKFTL